MITNPAVVAAMENELTAAVRMWKDAHRGSPLDASILVPSLQEAIKSVAAKYGFEIETTNKVLDKHRNLVCVPITLVTKDRFDLHIICSDLAEPDEELKAVMKELEEQE